MWLEAIKKAGFNVKNCIIWDRVVHGLGDLKGGYAPTYDMIIFATKERHILKGRRPKDVVRVKRVDADKLVHPTQKPIELIRQLIVNSSNKQDIVLDCYSGSGVVAVACKQLNRNFIGFEISKEYCDIAENRLKYVPERLDRWTND